MVEDLGGVGPVIASVSAPPAGGVYAPGVSIVICTYNRQPLLKGLIDSLLPLLPVAYPLEVLIVDNNSSDGTADYGRALAAEHSAVRYVFEGRQGLSHARNRGCRDARYGFLLYLDDDVTLPEHYLRTLGEELARHDPDFFGGPLYPAYVYPKPDWFPESLEVRKKAEVSGFSNNLSLTGANYGVKKSVLEVVGGFDPKYGMSGGKVGMLEERLVIETYRRLIPARDQKVYYCLETFILNYTPASRMTLGFQLGRIWIANEGFIRWCLEGGVRSPGILYRQIRRAFWGEIAAVAKAAPRLWRERKTKPEAPMLALVKLTYRTADLVGATRFFLGDFGKTRAGRLAKGVEDRPLRVLLLTQAMGPKAPNEASELATFRKVVGAMAQVETVAMPSGADDAIRKLVGDLNLRAVDVVVTDSPKAVRAISALRGSRPHLQIVLWARNPKDINALKSWRHLWDKRKGFAAKLRRDRALFECADQVVGNATWLGDLPARALLPMPQRVIIPPAPNDLAAAPVAVVSEIEAGWRGVLEAARLWAPRRLAP